MRLTQLQTAKDTYCNLHYFIKILGSVVFDTVSIDYENDDDDHTQVTLITVYDASGYAVLTVRADEFTCYAATTDDMARMFITNDYGKVVEL